MKYRQYDHKRDKKAVQRIWREIGWLEKGKEEVASIHIKSGRAIIIEVNNEAECCATAVPGGIHYLNEELPFSGITGVATSRIARKQGLAKQLTAIIVAIEAAEGALVSGLGVFEQGYYDQIGFGTGSYEHYMALDPSQLNIGIKPDGLWRAIPRTIFSESCNQTTIQVSVSGRVKTYFFNLFRSSAYHLVHSTGLVSIRTAKMY